MHRNIGDSKTVNPFRFGRWTCLYHTDFVPKSLLWVELLSHNNWTSEFWCINHVSFSIYFHNLLHFLSQFDVFTTHLLQNVRETYLGASKTKTKKNCSAADRYTPRQWHLTVFCVYVRALVQIIRVSIKCFTVLKERKWKKWRQRQCAYVYSPT